MKEYKFAIHDTSLLSPSLYILMLSASNIQITDVKSSVTRVYNYKSIINIKLSEKHHSEFTFNFIDTSLSFTCKLRTELLTILYFYKVFTYTANL